MYSEILLFHCWCWLAIWLRHYYANCCLHFWLFAVHENALEYLKKGKFCLKLLLFLILNREALSKEKNWKIKKFAFRAPYFSFYFSVNHAMEMIIATRNRYLFVHKRKCKHCSLEKRCPIYHDQDIGRLVLVPQIECRQDPKNWSNGQKQNFWPAFDWKEKRQTVLKKALINETATLHVWGHSVKITKFYSHDMLTKISWIQLPTLLLYYYWHLCLHVRVNCCFSTLWSRLSEKIATTAQQPALLNIGFCTTNSDTTN